jgi:hypothetical protein
MAGKAFAYSPDCQSRIIANFSFKVSLSESGITKTQQANSDTTNANYTIVHYHYHYLYR